MQKRSCDRVKKELSTRRNNPGYVHTAFTENGVHISQEYFRFHVHLFRFDCASIALLLKLLKKTSFKI